MLQHNYVHNSMFALLLTNEGISVDNLMTGLHLALYWQTLSLKKGNLQTCQIQSNLLELGPPKQ